MHTLRLVALSIFSLSSFAQGWTDADIKFKAYGLASGNGFIWACGENGSIASTQDGQLWNLRYSQPGGPTLRGIAFRDDHFGYAYGDKGSVFVTEDGGTTWYQKIVGKETILEAAFGDAKHGILRSKNSLIVTKDGGNTFQEAIQRPYRPLLQSYPFGQNLVASDALHMGFVISEGAYSDGGFLTSTDGGNSWVFYDRPSTGIGTFMQKDGKFWLIGMEVVGKDQAGGGHSVPLMASSLDGAAWSRNSVDISPCHWNVCRTCNTSGCLLANNQLINVFGDQTVYVFASDENALTSNFASLHSGSTAVICSVGVRLRCAPMRKAGEADKMGPAAPRVPVFDIPGADAPRPQFPVFLSPTASLKRGHDRKAQAGSSEYAVLNLTKHLNDSFCTPILGEHLEWAKSVEPALWPI